MVREAEKGKKVAKSKGVGKSKPKENDALKPEKGISKDRKCFYCEKSGHWKRNCPLYLEEVKKAKVNGASSSGTNPSTRQGHRSPLLVADADLPHHQWSTFRAAPTRSRIPCPLLHPPPNVEPVEHPDLLLLRLARHIRTTLLTSWCRHKAPPDHLDHESADFPFGLAHFLLHAHHVTIPIDVGCCSFSTFIHTGTRRTSRDDFASGFPNPPPQPSPEPTPSTHSQHPQSSSFFASYEGSPPEDDYDDIDYHGRRRRGHTFVVPVDEVLQGYLDFDNEDVVRFRSIGYCWSKPKDQS
ncbi:hypothetical protein V6N13_080817 [Hibiscus sabdariffa]